MEWGKPLAVGRASMIDFVVRPDIQSRPLIARLGSGCFDSKQKFTVTNT